ncbi:hypothetical protein B0H11DRAFT_1811164 [Mycena galericulata]|nr:hypothetical protein B0H11DRAFT_1811164 [Mycena galericulata]
MSLGQTEPVFHGLSMVPSEIVSEIFLHCKPDQCEPLPTEAPLLLLQVCAEWRNIAISTPELWKDITLFERHSLGVAKLLPVWLSRARLCPLSIEIIWPNQTIWNAVSAEICSAIDPFVDQLERLLLAVPGEQLAHLSFLHGQFPHLKELILDFQVPHSIHSEPFMRDLTVFSTAPMLHTVALMHNSLVPLRWMQLTELRLKSFSYIGCMKHMQRAVNMTCCFLLCPIPRLERPAPILAVPPLVALVSFHIICGLHDGILLAALTLPALRELSVSIFGDDTDRLLSFLDRSAPRLESLRIWTTQDETFILRCLDHSSSSSLQHLVLFFEAAFPTETIFRPLTSLAFLPSLESLFISESPKHLPPTPSYEGLFDVLCLRRNSYPQFRSFHLQTRRLLMVPDASQLRDLFHQGMSLKVERFLGDIELSHHTCERLWTLED